MKVKVKHESNIHVKSALPGELEPVTVAIVLYARQIKDRTCGPAVG